MLTCKYLDPTTDTYEYASRWGRALSVPGYRAEQFLYDGAMFHLVAQRRGSLKHSSFIKILTLRSDQQVEIGHSGTAFAVPITWREK